MAGSEAAARALRDWHAVHGDANIQFAPITYTPPKPEPPPEWLQMLGRWLEQLFDPLGKMFGHHWGTFQYVLIGLAGVGLVALLWFWLRPLWNRRRQLEAEEDMWSPSQQEALGLLADADRLAAVGRYDEATHLLLQRSVHHIAYAKPEWLNPASTAREIAGLAGLSDHARSAFSSITELVERSRYGLRPLADADWQVARAAYAGFSQGGIAA